MYSYQGFNISYVALKGVLILLELSNSNQHNWIDFQHFSKLLTKKNIDGGKHFSIQ